MSERKERRELLEQKIHLKMRIENGEAWTDPEEERFRLSKEGRRTALMGFALLAVFVCSVLFTVNVLSPEFSVATASHSVMRRVNDIVDLISGNHLQSGVHFFIIQFASAALAGVALAASGACFQAVFHNPMASPTMLGVQSGGSLGAVVYVLFFYHPMLSALFGKSYAGYAYEWENMSVFQKYGEYFFVLAGCVLVVVTVMLIAKGSGKGKIATVPLMVGGTVFTTTITSLITMVQYYESVVGGNPLLTAQIQALQNATFQAVLQPLLLLCFAIPVLVPLAVMMLMRGRMNLIAFGEEEARLMGVNVGFDRTVLVLLSTVMTAAVVSFCGAISFVGLIVPHFARLRVGSDFRYLLPASCFLGGLFLLLAYDLSYIINFYVGAGSMVNLCGGAVFMVFMTRYRRRGNADWA